MRIVQLPSATVVVSHGQLHGLTGTAVQIVPVVPPFVYSTSTVCTPLCTSLEVPVIVLEPLNGLIGLASIVPNGTVRSTRSVLGLVIVETLPTLSVNTTWYS